MKGWLLENNWYIFTDGTSWYSSWYKLNTDIINAQPAEITGTGITRDLELYEVEALVCRLKLLGSRDRVTLQNWNLGYSNTKYNGVIKGLGI